MLKIDNSEDMKPLRGVNQSVKCQFREEDFLKRFQSTSDDIVKCTKSKVIKCYESKDDDKKASDGSNFFIMSNFNSLNY